MEVLSVRRALALAALTALGACHRAAGPVQLGDVTTLATPGGVGTAPMLTVAGNGATAVAWVSAPHGGTDGRLYVKVDSAAPVELRDSLGPIEPHGEAPPKIVWGPEGALDAIYVVGRDDPAARFPRTALRFIRSSDHGATWTAPVTATSDAEFGAHSFHALHVAGDGTIYVAWLGGEPGKSTAWITHSSDAGVSWAPRVRVDTGNACPCCRTALATTSDGVLFMAWRHIYPGNVRDIVVARSNDHGATWKEPVRVHADDWAIDACPHAGPSILVDAANRVDIAWWTGKEGSAGVWFARSTDGGASFNTPVPLGVAKYSRPSHVQLALGPGNTLAAAWDDGTVKVPRVLLRISRDDGSSFGPAEPLSLEGRAATFPVVALHGDSLTAAWSDNAPSASAPASMSGMSGMTGMKDHTAHKGLEAVGSGTVVLRHGVVGD